MKYELTDVADVTAMNPNWDAIDTEMKRLADNNYITENEITQIVTFGERSE